MKNQKRKFWNFQKRKMKNQNGEVNEERILFINGTIAEESWFDDDVTPQIFKDELFEDKGDITVWINSPGGDCVAAAQIYNMLKEYKGKVTVKIDGLAASAGSVIAMAGDKVLASPVSLMMIHNPITQVYGDKQAIKQVISMLDEVKESIINAYEIKTGLDRDKISNFMNNETWMNANKAIELGFVDGLIDRKEIENIDIPVVASSYSPIKVMNSLLTKMVKKCQIERKVNINNVKASDLEDRLNLIKNWRNDYE